MAELIGRLLKGNYLIKEYLGRGGTASVYKVWDKQRAAFLAIKVLHASLAADAGLLAQFRREAQTLSDLKHPNIVRSYGLEEDGGIAFQLMDFVQGASLREEIAAAARPLAPERLLEIVRPVCSALHFAHQSGFVHCDVKPANIMIHSNGTVLVSDFGIAQRLSADAPATIGAGTPAYMAPEQAAGGRLTPRTDVYSLGIVLFEALTGGRRPFNGDRAPIPGTAREKILWEQVHQRPPSLSSLNPSVGPALEAVVQRCLNKAPHQRFQSVQELLQAMEGPLQQASTARPPQKDKSSAPTRDAKPEGSEARTPAATSRKRNPWPWIAAGVSLIALAMLLAGRGGGTPLYSTPAVRDTAVQQAAQPLPLPVNTYAAARPFTVRAFNSTTDAYADCILCRVSNWEDPIHPIDQTWHISFPSDIPVLILLGWCAADSQTLDATWPYIAYEGVTVDGFEIGLDELPFVSLANSSSQPCYAHRAVLEGWSAGIHDYVQSFSITQAINDGQRTYSAGRYTYRFVVDVY